MVDLASTDYQLVSADSHVNEPPDLWTARVPAKYKDRVPRIERFEKGDAWVVEGAREPINFGNNACAGLPPEEMNAWVPFDDIRAGGYDPAVRIEELDKDHVDAEALFPTPRLGQGVLGNKDVDLHLAMVRAYNDWLSEFASFAPARLWGLAMVPNCGTELAIEEIDRIAGLPGIRGVMIGCYPNGTLEIQPEDDKVWARLIELGLPINIHVSLRDDMPDISGKGSAGGVIGALRIFDAPKRMAQFIVTGVLDRFPELRVVFAEVDCGWVPYIKEQFDNSWRRRRPAMDLKRPPSEYIEQHFYFGYMTDTFAIHSRNYIGVDRILWSSDYAHTASDWPVSWKPIQAAFSGVPTVERQKILAGNAVELYGIER